VSLPSTKDQAGSTGEAAGGGDSAGTIGAGAVAGSADGQFNSELTGYSDASSPSLEAAGDVATDGGALGGGSVFEPAPPVVGEGGLPGGDYASGPVVHERDPGSYPPRGDVPNTRRRSVVFEEDDELDVPDFLK
jgi:hypothetical protein